MRAKSLHQLAVVVERTLIEYGFPQQVIAYLMSLFRRSVPEKVLVFVYKMFSGHLLLFFVCKGNKKQGNRQKFSCFSVDIS